MQESGAVVLDELRRAFSAGYLRRMLRSGAPHLEHETKTPCDPAWLDVADGDSEWLYAQRRDAEGVPSTKPARQRQPHNSELLGFFHLLLKRGGAIHRADGYEINGRKVRVINGAGSVLSSLRSRFVEAPAVSSPDVIAAVGSTDLALPGNVIRDGRPKDIVRPATPGEWFDFQSARELLKI